MLTSVGAAIALLGSFLPWLYSGDRGRSSYELFDIVDRLGFAEGGLVGVVFRLWPLVPLVIVVSVVVQWWPGANRSLRRWLPIGAAVYVLVVAIAVWAAPDIALFRMGAGVATAASGATAMLTTQGLVLLGLADEPADQADTH